MDLDKESVAHIGQLFSQQHEPSWSCLSDFEFLKKKKKKIGAYPRSTGKRKEGGFTVAGVLMFGTEDAIYIDNGCCPETCPITKKSLPE